MGTRISNIRIRILSDGEVTDVETFKGEYRNLMDLINDKIYVDCFGECKGMGRCGTCVVKIIGDKTPQSLDRNGQATLAKLGVTDTSVKLACQIPIDHSAQELQVAICEKRAS